MKKILLLLSLIAISFTSCQQEEHIPTTEEILGGTYTKPYINKLSGFEDNLIDLLNASNLSHTDFILYSTNKAWEYPEATRTIIKNFRESIDFPTSKTLLQKVITTNDMDTYINNTYGGTIGGFVSVAADMKRVYTMHDVYWGLRLDYEKTQFKEDASAYAVIRFKSEFIKDLQIPFCEELGGTYPHSWPNGGGGFTTSTLGKGGYPEYKFNSYMAPKEGAEIYEVSKNGYEILRAKYTAKNKWQMVDKGYSPEVKSVPSQEYELKYAMYKGKKFFLRANINGICHLTTFENYPELELEVKEKGIWGIQIPENQVEIL